MRNKKPKKVPSYLKNIQSEQEAPEARESSSKEIAMGDDKLTDSNAEMT